MASHVLWIASDINAPAAKTPATTPKLDRRLEDVTRNRHLNIAKFLDSPESSAGGAELHLLVTNPEHHSQRLLDNGYSPFTPGYVVTAVESFGIYLAVYAAFTAFFIATALAGRLVALGLLCRVPVPAIASWTSTSSRSRPGPDRTETQGRRHPVIGRRRPCVLW